MSKHVLTVIVAVIIGVSLFLYMFAFQVRESEKVVVLRFGKPAAVQPEPGYHFKWPWPIEEVRRFDARIHVSEGKIEETRTKDGNNIIVSLCVGWRVSDPQIFNQNFGRADQEKQEDEAWGKIESIVRDRTLATLGNYELGQLVNVQTDKLRYDQIEDEIREKANATLGPAGLGVKDFGVEIVLAKIRRLELPASVTSAVYARMVQERGCSKRRSTGPTAYRRPPSSQAAPSRNATRSLPARGARRKPSGAREMRKPPRTTKPLTRTPTWPSIS